MFKIYIYMSFIKLIPKNIPKKLTDNNTLYLSILLILTISAFTKKYKFLSLYIIIQSLVFFIFSKNDKFKLMLLINILSFICLVFLFIKSKSNKNLEEGFKDVKRMLSSTKRAAKEKAKKEKAKKEKAAKEAKIATNMINTINDEKKINKKLQDAINNQKKIE